MLMSRSAGAPSKAGNSKNDEAAKVSECRVEPSPRRHLPALRGPSTHVPSLSLPPSLPPSLRPSLRPPPSPQESLPATHRPTISLRFPPTHPPPRSHPLIHPPATAPPHLVVPIRQVTKLEEYIKARDYTGALALLEFNRKTGDEDEDKTLMWIGYSAFHLGQYQRGFDAYQEVINTSGNPPHEVYLYQAACLYYMQMYSQAEEKATEYVSVSKNALKDKIQRATTDEAVQEKSKELKRERMKSQAQYQKMAADKPPSDEEVRQQITKEIEAEHSTQKAPELSLKNRLLFHLAHKIDDQDKLMLRHQELTDTQEDQLSLAAIHYLRSHFQEVHGCTPSPPLPPLQLIAVLPPPSSDTLRPLH